MDCRVTVKTHGLIRLKLKLLAIKGGSENIGRSENVWPEILGHLGLNENFLAIEVGGENSWPYRVEVKTPGHKGGSQNSFPCRVEAI